MKKKIATIIKRMVSFGLVLAMILTSTNVYATEGEVSPVDSTDELKTVSYNMETGEITYEVYEVEDLTDVSSLEIQDDEISTHHVIGIDNRSHITNTTDSPYRNVCCLVITYPNGSKTIGSGVLVYFDVLLTAAHCVYQHDRGGWATSIEIVPGRQGENKRPLGTAYPTKTMCSQEWIDNRNYDGDWAIIDLDRSFDTWQLFGYYNNYYNQLGTSVTAIGYPGEEDIRYHMYADTNSISYVTEYQYTVLCDLTGGQSGGALIDDKSGYLIGIISNEKEIVPGEEYANRCLRLTPALCSVIQSHYD